MKYIVRNIIIASTKRTAPLATTIKVAMKYNQYKIVFFHANDITIILKVIKIRLRHKYQSTFTPSLQK